MAATAIVLDTNVLVAGAFSRTSASARIVEAARAGELRIVWNEATRGETERILRRIPVLDESSLDGLFTAENHFVGETRPEHFVQVADPGDRKFAALAHAADAVLISNDAHLLEACLDDRVVVVTPSAFWRSR